jgi:hypothetical protein
LERCGEAAAFGVQRRMADWSFEKARTWEDLLAAHEKWIRDYNFQKHMAHDKRDDGCHSPAAVLQWIKGVQPEPELVYQAFSALCGTRRLGHCGLCPLQELFAVWRVEPGWRNRPGRYLSRCTNP